MSFRSLFSALAVAFLLVPRAGGQSAPGAAPPATPVAAVDTAPSPMVFDLVVRQKKGLPVEDLRAEEVELYVDGVRQSFEGFRRVAIAAPGTTPAAQPGAASLAVLLFPRLPGAQRDLAQSAAEEFLKKQLVPGMSVAVLLVGPELVPVQGFTQDPAVLKDAIRRALDPAARSGDPDVRSLYSVVQWLKDQPGRKTAVLFSAGLAVPSGFEESVPDLIGLANRYRVSFYAVDPRGLEVSRGGIRIDQQAGDNASVGGSAGPSTQLYGYGGGSRIGEDLQGYGQGSGPSFQGPSGQALATLARGTGGLAFEQTNSFSKGMRQIAEDMSGHYELTYTPTASRSEGQFRQVDFKVTREGATVQARQQYPVGGAAATLVPAFERRLSDALSAEHPASDVEVWDRALHFAWDGKEMTHVLWVAVPLEKVSLAAAGAAAGAVGRFEGDVSILARVRDASGGIVATFSQRFPLVGPLDQLPRTRAMTIPFVRRAKLAPGEYTLEVAVQDGHGGGITARRTPFKVRAPQGLALSSLTLGGVVPAGTGSDPDDPLRIGAQRLVPNLGQPIKAGHASMTLHSVVYVTPGSKEPANITITLLLGDQPANTATAVLPAPDAAGRISYASALKMDVLPPGSYRFKVAVTQGASRAEENLSFAIAP